MQRVSAALAVSFALARGLASAPCQAAELWDANAGPVQIEAQVLEYESERALYVAEGQVRVVQQDGRRLEADWVAVSGRTRRGVASGHVVIVDGDETLRADFVEFDLDRLVGVVFEGRFEASPFRIWAREMQKTGDRSYALERGGFTTCNCPDDGREPWRVRAREAELEVGGYGTVRNATVEVLGIPVIWLPWMIYPIKTERESGLLFPEFAFGARNGFEVGLPLFWAAGDPLNVTLTPRYLTQRGFKPNLKLDWVMGEQSGGSLFVSYLRDREVQSRKGAVDQDPFDSDRWALRLRSDNWLPGEWRLRSEVDVVSDNRYVADFAELAEHRRDRFLESRLWARRHFGADGSAGLVASIVYADDLQNPDDVDRDQFLLQRVPAVSFDWLPTPLLNSLGLSGALDLDYIYFRPRRKPRDVLRANPVVGEDLFLDTGIDGLPNREEGSEARRRTNTDGASDIHGDDAATGGPEGDGLFQEGEPLADRGHRLVFHPRLARAFRFADALELYPEIGYQETLYFTSAQGFEERGVLSGRADLRARLTKQFGPRGVTHIFEPQLSWLWMRPRSQRENPLFVPRSATPQRRIRQLALDAVVRDPSDRIEDVHALVLGFGNRFYAGSRLLADFRLSGDWDFERGRVGALVLDGSVFAVRGVNSRFDVVVDPARGRIDEGLVEASLGIRGWGGIGARYRFLRRIPLFFESFRGEDKERFAEFDESFERVHQLSGSARIGLGRRFTLGYNVAYALDQDLFLANRGVLEYTSKCKCWAIQLEVRDDRSRGLQYSVRYTLLGLGDDSGNPFAGKLGLGSSTGFP